MAIALIVQSEDGGIEIIGSKSVYRSTIEMNHDFHQIEPGMSIRGLRSFRVEAECDDLTWQYRAQSIATPQIAQRGIYLPDMSFRALPEPSDA
jgi:hypothetical protein